MERGPDRDQRRVLLERALHLRGRGLPSVEARHVRPGVGGAARHLLEQARLADAAGPVDVADGRGGFPSPERPLERLELGFAPDEPVATPRCERLGQHRAPQWSGSSTVPHPPTGCKVYAGMAVSMAV
nr:hypothetical protein [Egibacter rhizosphaerae]